MEYRLLAKGGKLLIHPGKASLLVTRNEPAVLLQSEIIQLGERTSDGEVVEVVQLPWRKIADEIVRDPEFLRQFPGNHRRFEEFLAGIYRAAGFDEVVLTPQRGDDGRDVIATKFGFCTVRILGQAKAFKSGHLVGHDDVRAMLGVLSAEPSASKGMIVTTSSFAPGILTSPKMQQFSPSRLELVDGNQLVDWLSSLSPPASR
jgi:restriction system protein